MERHNQISAARRAAALFAGLAGLALVAGCSSAGPGASPSASPSASEAVRIASDVSLEEQLYDALRAGDARLTEALLDAGANVDAQLANDTTAIHIAVVRDDPALVAVVLAAGPDLTVADQDGVPLLNAACFRGVSGEVAGLLVDAGADVNGVSDEEFGSLPIHECAYSGSVDAIDALIERGADVNARQTVYGGTPLIVAAWQGDEDTVMHLLELGADPTLTTNDGATARKWAQVAGDEELADLLATVGG